MNALLPERIRCDRCGASLGQVKGVLICEACGREIALQDGIPLFTQPPEGIQPSAKIKRGPDTGTPWRRENWRFLGEQIANLPHEAVILDIGAGRGDFEALYQGRRVVALDVYPYPEIDIVCDLTLANPFKPRSFDAIVLMNVLEHVYYTDTLLESIADILKDGGLLIIAIPFMVKMHQTPIDYVRYTHYALEQLGRDHGLKIIHLEGFYDPISLLGEGLGNLRNAVLPELRGARHYAGRAVLMGLQALSNLQALILPPGGAHPTEGMRSQAPTGYQVVYLKGR